MNLLKRSLIAPSLALLLYSNIYAEDIYTMESIPLKDAIEKLSEDMKLPYIVDSTLLKGKKTKKLEKVKGAKKALFIILKESGLEAEIKNDTIIIKEKKSNSTSSSLGEIDVIATSNNITEGSGSYTLGATSTATNLNMSLKDTPQSISIITSQRIEDQKLNSVTDVLEQSPGISVQSLGNGGRFTILSRGGYTISNYQLDSIPTYSNTGTQTVSQGLADMAVYDHIEVIRGATGLMTGAGDPSGTINMVRKKTTKDTKANIDTTVGSWNLYRLQADVSGALNENGSIRARVVGAYQHNESFIDYFEEEKKVFYSVVEADLSDTTLLSAGIDYQEYKPKGSSGTGFPLFYSDGSRTDLPRSTNPATKWSYDNKKTYNAFATLEQELIDDWKLKASINYMHTDREFYNALAASWQLINKDTNIIKTDGAAGDAEQKQKGLDINIDGTYKLFDREHELILGYSYFKYNNLHSPLYNTGVSGNSINYFTWDNNTIKPDTSNGKLYNWTYDITQRGSYLATRFHPNNDLSLILGARFSDYEYSSEYDYIPSSLTQYSNKTKYDDTAFTPYAGVVYDLNDVHAIYASYTSVFQPQNSKDRSGNTLDPREGNNYELGYKNELFGGALNSSIAIYKIQQENLAVADSGYYVPGTTTAAYKAVDGATTKGLDLEASGEITKNFSLSASYTYSVTEDQSGERIQTTYPKHLAKLWSTYNLNKMTFGGGVNWQSKIYFDGSSPLYSDIDFHAEQEAYYVVNLMGSYEINKNLLTKVNINNLFDKKYLSSLDDTFYSGAYGDPRNFSISLKYTF